MKIKKDKFIKKYLKWLEHSLEKGLPNEACESDYLLQAMNIDVTSSQHTLEAMRHEKLD